MKLKINKIKQKKRLKAGTKFKAIASSKYPFDQPCWGSCENCKCEFYIEKGDIYNLVRYDTDLETDEDGFEIEVEQIVIALEERDGKKLGEDLKLGAYINADEITTWLEKI